MAACTLHTVSHLSQAYDRESILDLDQTSLIYPDPEDFGNVWFPVSPRRTAFPTQCLLWVVFCRFALTVARQHSGNELLRQVNGQYERVAVTGIRGLMAFTDRVL